MSDTTNLDICPTCGQEIQEVQSNRPEGCVCDIASWGDAMSIKPVCEQYEGDGETHCAECEHDKECHKEEEQ